MTRARKNQIKLANIVSVTDFGAVGDGVTDDTAAIQAAVSAANASGALLKFAPGTYKITGSTRISIKTNVDFAGAVIDASAWTAGFKFERAKTPVTYGAGSSVVTAFNASTLKVADSAFFDGWGSTTEVNNALVKITTDQDYFRYRGGIQKRVELNRMLRRGVATAALRHTMSGVNATSVVVYPMEDRCTTAENLVIDVRGRAAISSPLIWIETSLHKLRNVTFLTDDNVFETSNPTLVYCDNSCHIEIDGLYLPWAPVATSGSGGASVFTYTMDISNSFDVVVRNAKSDGPGWGTVGNNTCQRVVFEKCDLSRIDFHLPFREYLRVRDCVVGSWGVSVSALGDLEIENTRFVQRSANAYVPGVNGRFIAARTDAGGFCDGHLRVRDCSFTSTLAIPLLRCVPDSGNPLPAGSPIDNCFWKSITVENCTFSDGVITQLQPDIVQTDSSVKHPLRLHYKNCNGNVSFVANLASQFPYATSAANATHPNRQINLQVVVEAMALREFTLLGGASPTFNAEVRLDGVTTRTGETLTIKPTVPGFYNITGCRFSDLNLNGDTSPSSPMYVTVSDCRMVHGTAPLYVQNTSPLGRVLFRNTIFSASSAANVQTAIKSFALYEKCVFMHTDNTPRQIISTNDLSGAASGTLTFSIANPQAGQTFYLVCGFGGSSTLQYTPVVIPYTSSSVAVAVLDAGTGATGIVRLNRTAAATIDVSGTAAVRYLALGEPY